MTTDAPQATKVISTSNAEIDKKMGGGIPLGSLTLIEGQSDAGKSVVSQHLAFGALHSDVAVAYYTAENTVKSLLTQMASLGLDVTDHFLVDRLRIYPLQITREMNTDIIFTRITKHIETLPLSIPKPWFTDQTIDWEDGTGQNRSTTVTRRGCVFLTEDFKCAIHRYCLEHGLDVKTYKPNDCISYPFMGGELLDDYQAFCGIYFGEPLSTEKAAGASQAT